MMVRFQITSGGGQGAPMRESLRTCRASLYLLTGLLLVVLLMVAGCVGLVTGMIALREAQELFNEASVLTIEGYQNALQTQAEGMQPGDMRALESPHEKYRRVVEIIEGRVLNSVNRDELKVTAHALAAFSHWRLGDYPTAIDTAEKGRRLYERAGLMTNRRDYGMLLIVGGLVLHSEAYSAYQRRKEQGFLSVEEAQTIADEMNSALKEIDAINTKLGKGEPIVIYANQQQLLIIKNIIRVWEEGVQGGEEQEQAVNRWTEKAKRILENNFPAGDYPTKPLTDKLKQELIE